MKQEVGHPMLFSLLLLLLVVLLLFSFSSAQEEEEYVPNEVSYLFLSPLLALIIMGFMGFLFLVVCAYSTFRQFIRQQDEIMRTTVESEENGRQRQRGTECMTGCGIDRVVIEEFPMSVYSDLKGELHLQEYAVECAICLTEFEDDDMLRQLPICGHVFHPECINMWLASHVTCPVCRDILVVPCSKSNGDNIDDVGPVTVIIHDEEQYSVSVSVAVGEPCSRVSGQP